jgi:predicted RNase H-like HicB family nuclease
MSKNTIAKGYYAVFECSSDAVDVEFPGLPGCQTCGKDMEEAYDLSTDALAGWLEAAEAQFIPEKPMSFEEVREQFPDKVIMRIPVDRSIMKQYEPKQRFNASFPKSVLERVDAFAQSKGWNRSQFLVRASERMISENLA